MTNLNSFEQISMPLLLTIFDIVCNIRIQKCLFRSLANKSVNKVSMFKPYTFSKKAHLQDWPLASVHQGLSEFPGLPHFTFYIWGN